MVIGASGGCGIAAVQLARALGASHVAGICSSRNLEVVLKEGAHEVLDYTTTSIEERYAKQADEGKFDIVFDAATCSGAGEDYKSASLRVLRGDGGKSPSRGEYVAINGSLGMWLRLFTGFGQRPHEHLFLTDANTKDLQTLATLTDAGWEQDGEKRTLRPVIAKELPFDAAAVASGFELLKSRRTVGKIVFSVST